MHKYEGRTRACYLAHRNQQRRIHYEKKKIYIFSWEGQKYPLLRSQANFGRKKNQEKKDLQMFHRYRLLNPSKRPRLALYPL